MRHLGTRRVVSPLTEVLGYSGGVLGVLAVFFLFGQFGYLLSPWAKLVLLGITASVLFGAGAWLRDGEADWRSRLTGALWLGSVAVGALFVAFLFRDVIGAEDDTTRLAAGVGAILFAAPLWRIRPGALQQLTLFAGLMLGLVSGLELAEWVDSAEAALFVWALGAAWAVLSWARVIAPTRTGYVLGGLTALGAAQILVFQGWGLGPGLYGAWGLTLGAATSAGLLAASVAVGAPVLLGLGTTGTFVFVAQIAFRFFAGIVDMPLALLIAGMLLIALSAVLVTRLRPQILERGASLSHRLQGRRVSIGISLVVIIFLVTAVVAPWSVRRANVFEAVISPDGVTIVLYVATCNATLSATTNETPTTAEVAVFARDDTMDACADAFYITLDEPLGDRVLIDRYDGQPIDLQLDRTLRPRSG